MDLLGKTEGAVTLRLRLGPESMSGVGTYTPEGDMPCFKRVTPVNVVNASEESLAATSF